MLLDIEGYNEDDNNINTNNNNYKNNNSNNNNDNNNTNNDRKYQQQLKITILDRIVVTLIIIQVMSVFTHVNESCAKLIYFLILLFICLLVCLLIVQGIARTQSPLRKNYALESPAFGVIAGVSQTGVQW